jgi:hypothetical protein
MQLKFCDTDVAEYYVGMDGSSMVKYYFPESAGIARKLENLKASTPVTFPFE